MDPCVDMLLLLSKNNSTGPVCTVRCISFLLEYGSEELHLENLKLLQGPIELLYFKRKSWVVRKEQKKDLQCRQRSV
jgi:hypothetical protein